MKDTEGLVATSMKAKEAMVRRSAFPSPPTSFHDEPVVMPGVAHQTVTEDVINKALMTQSMSKAPGPDKFNFRILRKVWEWDSKRLITMVQYSIRLVY